MPIVIKKISCVVFISLLFFQFNYLSVYYSLYKLNVKVLTERCCEKKVENCRARCYLDKKMNEESDGNRKGLSIESKDKLSDFEITDHFLKQLYPLTRIYFTNANLNIEKQFIPEIEHPPQFLIS